VAAQRSAAQRWVIYTRRYAVYRAKEGAAVSSSLKKIKRSKRERKV
jgi:hypothetical protein